MVGQFRVALMTREPVATAGKFDRDDVVGSAIMPAPCFLIDIDADNFDAVNFHAFRSRGQISTRTDPMIQHAIIMMKPMLNEPVR